MTQRFGTNEGQPESLQIKRCHAAAIFAPYPWISKPIATTRVAKLRLLLEGM
jgi:hypothetical protein